MKPNVLLLHCHDLGRFLHCYGVETVRTPQLDAFAAEGVRLANSFCPAPQCSPSRASLFTGRYPHNNGMLGLAHADFAWDLYPDEKHLAQYLKQAGYQTTAIGVLHETHSHHSRCGLDEWIGAPTEPAVEATRERLERFARDRNQPFYMQVGFVEPHRLPAPGSTADLGFLGGRLEPDDTLGVQVPGYLADTPGTRTELAELQGAVHYIDGQIGRILDRIKELGLDRETLVLFTTDHGIAMPRAKCSLYDPGLETACLLRLPAREGWHGGRVLEPMISNLDVLPTILELAGVPVPARVQGRSFAPLLDGQEYAPREALFGEITYHDYYDPRRCIRTATHKLIVNFSTAYSFMDPSQSWRPRSDTVVPANHALAYHSALELFDLRADPWELHDLAPDPAHAGTRTELMQRLYRHLVETEDPILAGAVTSPMHRRAVSLLEEASR